MEDFKQKIVSGFAWEASARLIVQLASWASTFIVINILLPEDYGIVGVSGIFTGLCLQIAGMGLYKALVNKKILGSHDLSNIFWLSNLLSVCIYLALFVAAPVIADYNNLPELEPIIRVAGLMVVFSSLGMVPHAILMRELKFRATALIAMAANFIVIAITLLLAFRGWGYWSLILSTITGEIFTSIAFFVVVGYLPRRPKQLSTVIPMFIYGSKLLSAGLVTFASSKIAVAIASVYLGIVAVGNYEIAYMIAALPMTKIGELFHKIGFPAFSQIQNDLERTKSVFLKMHRILFMVTAPMFVGIALTADLLVPVVAGDEWIAIIDPIRILCVLNIFMVSAQLVPRVLEGIGNSTAGLIYQGILLVTGSISMLVGVQWGLNWMLIGWAIAFPIGYLYILKVLFSILKLPAIDFFNSIQKTLISTLVMCGIVLLVNFALNYIFPLPLNIESGASISQPRSLMIILLIIKAFTGVVSFYGCYFLLAKQDLYELLALVKK